jgi:hypothetical protein
MMTQHKNFKTISGETQNYELFKKILLRSFIPHDSISLREELPQRHICTFMKKCCFTTTYRISTIAIFFKCPQIQVRNFLKKCCSATEYPNPTRDCRSEQTKKESCGITIVDLKQLGICNSQQDPESDPLGSKIIC